MEHRVVVLWCYSDGVALLVLLLEGAGVVFYCGVIGWWSGAFGL